MKWILAITSLLITGCSSSGQALISEQPYPIILSFSSMGSGVPDETAVKNFINEFKKQHQTGDIKGIHFGPIGREGEYRLLFLLSGWSDELKSQFVEGLSNTIKQTTFERGQIGFQLNTTFNPADYPKRAKPIEVTY